MTLSLALLLLGAIQSLAVVALSPISVKGTKLYDDEGNQFFLKGAQTETSSTTKLIAAQALCTSLVVLPPPVIHWQIPINASSMLGL
jgi:hypothetical protein